MAQFDSILVANRGEIAVRVIRSARQQGYRTIAVYSEADAHAPHVRMADEAVLLGPAPSKESYLNIDRILAAAAQTRAQAVHPGYGFLSENAAFARACETAGLVYIGPRPESIELMGNKAAAKRRMLAAGVPCIPGYQSEDQSDRALLAAAEDIGTPIMVKAAAGGGGRGMRLAMDLAALPAAIAAARSEAANAFGSDELILEKAVLQPRHVEIQVFGDVHGNLVHFGERDCSVQRRHQKVVEESPCPVMTPALRTAMGEAALNAAHSIDYRGAGTVEFLLDGDGRFYFLEMNTRLQVEHPVTEMVTGYDLVALQLLVAQGYPLPVVQEDIALTGHAIEARLYAEDPVNDFLPAAGRVHTWLPPGGEGIRVDHGLSSGQEISPYYDPMIAKIVAWGEDRDMARRRLLRALQATTVFGIETNRQFLIDVLGSPPFSAGTATTAFIAEQFPQGVQTAPVTDEHLACAAVLQYRQGLADSERARVTRDTPLRGWTGLREIHSHFRFARDAGSQADIYVQQIDEETYALLAGERNSCVKWLADDRSGAARVLFDGVQHDLAYAFTGRGAVSVQLGGRSCVLTNELAFTRGDEAASGSGSLKAPMHGNIIQLTAAVGDAVEAGQELVTMEAMKMEHRLSARISGRVRKVYIQLGQQVAAGTVLLEIAEE